MTLSKLRVVLEASVGGFNRAMRSSGSALRGMVATTGNLVKSVLSLKFAFSAFLAVLAVRRVFDMAKAVFDLGAAVAETQSMFRTVFGEGSKKVQAFIEDFATMAGSTRRAAQEMLATTGQIVQGMGVTQAASADLSIEVLKLAADWASFKNLQVDDTLLRINAALTGERESLKRLGAVILEVDVQQRAMHDNRLTSIKDITQEMKVLATLAILQEKSGVVLGDLERTQNSAANRAKQLGAAWGDLRNTLATMLQPAFLSIMETMANSELSFVHLDARIKENAAVIVGWVAATGVAFKAFFETVKFTFTAAAEMFMTFIDIIKLNWTGTMAEMQARWLAMINTLSVGLLELGSLQIDVQNAFNAAILKFNAAAGAAEAGMESLTFATATTIEKVSALDSELTKMATNFADSVADAAREGAAAFEGFFDSVIRGLSRLAAKMLMFKGLEFLYPGSSFVQAFGASAGLASSAASAGGGGGQQNLHLLTGSETGFTGPLGARVPGAGTPRFVQNVNFNVSAIDGASVATMIERQKGSIVAVVAEAAQNSSALRRTMRGG